MSSSFLNLTCEAHSKEASRFHVDGPFFLNLASCLVRMDGTREMGSVPAMHGKCCAQLTCLVASARPCWPIGYARSRSICLALYIQVRQTYIHFLVQSAAGIESHNLGSTCIESSESKGTCQPEGVSLLFDASTRFEVCQYEYL